MKGKTGKMKAIVMSALTIGCCGALIVGATVAAFTSSQEYSFNVHSGEISISSALTLDSMSYRGEADSDATSVADNAQGDGNASENAITLENGYGSAAVNGEQITMTLAQGTTADFTLTVTNASTVAAKYVAYLVLDGNASAYTFTGGAAGDSSAVYFLSQNEGVGGWVSVSPDVKDAASVQFSIGLGWGAQAAASSRISLIFRAVQGNASSSISVGGDSYPTLLEAMQAADADEAIVLDAGVTAQWPSRGEIESLGTKPLTVIGAGRENTTLESSAANDWTIDLPDNVTVSGVKLNRKVNLLGSANLSDVSFGNGMTVDNEDAADLPEIIMENAAFIAGGVSAKNADATLTDCTASSRTFAYIAQGGSLTLNDCTFTKSNADAIMLNAVGAEVTVNGGTYISVDTVLGAFDDAEVTIEDGTFKAPGGKNIVQLGNYPEAGEAAPQNGAKLTVNGGTFEESYGSAATAFVVFSDSELVFNDGTVDVGFLGFSGQGLNKETISITVNGGTVNAGLAFYLPSSSVLNVTGGTITALSILDMRMGTATISGNAVLEATDPSHYLTDMKLQNDNGSSAASGGAVTDGSAFVLNTNLYRDLSAGENDPGKFEFTLKDSAAVTAASGRIVSVYDWNDAQNILEGEQEVVLDLGNKAQADGEIGYYNYDLKESTPTKSVWEPITVLADGFCQNLKTNVYHVTNAAGLAYFANSVNEGTDYAGETVVLDGDIDLSEVRAAENWTPIGQGMRSGSGLAEGGKSFSGTFDGNGKTVSNLTFSGAYGDDNAFGLIGVLNGGVVKDLTLANVSVNVTDGECVGAVAGLMINGATVSGVTVESGSVTAVRGNGGIVGRMTVSGTIENCNNHASITATSVTSGNVGGIVGAAYYTGIYADESQTMHITDCTNTGTVTAACMGAGGIVGLSSAYVSGCTNSGAVAGNGASIGGIVGEQQNYGAVTDCVNTANIVNTNTAAYGTGGIVGWIRYSGAVADYQTKAPIQVIGCSNSGTIDGGNDGGGIVGTLYDAGLVQNCLNEAERIQGETFAAGIVGNLQVWMSNDKPAEIPVPEGSSLERGALIVYNISTTTEDRITVNGACKDLFAYNNDSQVFFVGVNYTNTEDAEQKIARVDDQLSFKNALGSVEEGGTIVLEADVVLRKTGNHPSGTSNSYIAIPNVTIDLGGHTVTVEPIGSGISVYGSVFGLAANGITLKNGIVQQDSYENSAYPLYVTSGAKNVLIDNVTLRGGVQVVGNSTATLRNVTITAQNWYCVYLEYNSTCTIESGTFTRSGNQPHIYTAQSSDTVIVNGGIFDGSTTPAYGGNGTLIDNTLVSE